MKFFIKQTSYFIISLLLAGFIGCGGGGGEGETGSDAGDDAGSISLADNYLKISTAYTNAIISATTSFSDDSNPNKVEVTLHNSDNSVTLTTAVFIDCSSTILGVQGSYTFTNYIDANGVVLNGTLDYYTLGSVSTIFILQGTITATGSANGSYIYKCKSDGGTLSGYAGISGQFYNYSTSSITAIEPLITLPDKPVIVPCASPRPVVDTTIIRGNSIFTLSISGVAAQGGGNISDEGTSEVTDRGICWNTTGKPTKSDSYVSDGTTGPGSFTNCYITGLSPDTIYYVRAYATNSSGTAYGSETSFNSGKTFGTDYAGGYVIYNDGNGGGLVAAKTNQSTGYVWIEGGSTQTTLNGNTSTAIGTGLANSEAIVAQEGHTNSAAALCLAYDDGTYSDWFLPSRDELDLIYLKLNNPDIGGFLGNLYWSSSQYTITTIFGPPDQKAYGKLFYNGAPWDSDKNSALFVRAVRVF